MKERSECTQESGEQENPLQATADHLGISLEDVLKMNERAMQTNRPLLVVTRNGGVDFEGEPQDY